ncbi:MAG: sulfatase [Phycisphaerales bacterium]|nr:MAG: sulfatase [Phycisphaerales bacterium]
MKALQRILVSAVLCLVTGMQGGCDRERTARDQASAPAVDGPTPNIILVMIDALRADRLGVQGHPRKLTPTLDSIAAGSVIFERAIAAAPWTQPSIASLFSGCYPGVHQVTDFGFAVDATNRKVPKIRVFRDSFDTMAEALRARGYSTAGFVANPFVLADYGFAQGFDHFDTTFIGLTTPGSVINDAAIAWLQQRDVERPFFLYLHYMDVHGPYHAPPEFLDPLVDEVDAMPAKRSITDKDIRRLAYLGGAPPGCTDLPRFERLSHYQEYWAARYDAGVAQADHYLGELRSKLQTMKLWETAYVIVTADHGEALFEHGHWDHGLSTHHPELHVPLIVRWPTALPADTRVADTVRLIDLFPTLVEQLRLPKVSRAQGRSLLPLLADQAPAAPLPAFAEAVKKGPEQYALYRGDWKLILHADSGSARLYNIADDPLEQRDLAANAPAQLKSLTALVQERLGRNRRLAAGEPVEEIPLTPDRLDRLRSLGYVE